MMKKQLYKTHLPKVGTHGNPGTGYYFFPLPPYRTRVFHNYGIYRIPTRSSSKLVPMNVAQRNEHKADTSPNSSDVHLTVRKGTSTSELVPIEKLDAVSSERLKGHGGEATRTQRLGSALFFSVGRYFPSTPV